jgi:hypothetical protein
MKWKLLVATVVVLAASLLAQDSGAIKTDPADLSRPLAMLVSQLRKRGNIAVSYEDPRYSKRDDMDGPNAAFTYSTQEFQGGNGVEVILQRMLRKYTGSGGLTFDLARDGARFYIIPAEVKDPAGKRVRQDSILDTIINIPPAHRNGSEFLQAICDAVGGQTGYQIDIGPSAPVNNLHHYSTEEGANNQTARAALVQILDRATPPGTFAWDLYYDPEDKSYGLNFAYVGLAGPVRK